MEYYSGPWAVHKIKDVRQDSLSSKVVQCLHTWGIQLEWNVKTQFLFGTSFSTWSSATCEMPAFNHLTIGPDHRPHITEFQNARNVAPANHVSTRPHCQITSTKRRASSFTLRRHVILQINAPHARSIHQHILGWLFWAKCQVI